MDRPPGGPEGGDEVRREVDEYIRGIQPPPKEVLELEFVFEALVHPRRRYLIYSLISNSVCTIRELATKLVAWERDVPEEAVTDFDRDEMFISLHHAHIPKLVDYGIVEYRDGEEGVIVAAENAVQVLAALEGLGSSLDILQEAHARSDYETE